jgi:hypothetical protein
MFSLFLVFATYNPSGTSFYHWAVSGFSPLTLVSVVGVALLAIYVFLFRSTWRSIKITGILIGAVFMGLFNLMLVDLEIVTIEGNSILVVMFLASLATILSIGVSFSAIRARLAGQIDSDDVGR